VAGGWTAVVAKQPRGGRATGAANCGTTRSLPTPGRGTRNCRPTHPTSPERRHRPWVYPASPNSPELPQTGAVEDIPTLDSLSRARGSRPGQRIPSRWASVRYWKPLSGPKGRILSDGADLQEVGSVSPSEERGQQRGACSDHFAA